MKEKKDTLPLSAKTTPSSANVLDESLPRIVDYSDVLKPSKANSPADTERFKELAAQLKEMAKSLKTPIWTAKQAPIRFLPEPGGGILPGTLFTHSFTIKSRKMGLSMEQRRYHEIHDIGINDLLTRFFISRAEDITFNKPSNWPTQVERYELTMGRTGYIGDKSPEYSVDPEDSEIYDHYIDQYVDSLHKPSCIGCESELSTKKPKPEPQATTDYQLDKKYWLSQAIQHSCDEYGSMFSPGQMIKLNDTAMVWHESEWGRMVKTIGLPEKDKFWTTKGGLISMQDLTIYNDGHYCHKDDTALVIGDQVRCRVVIRNVEEWTGSVQFFRVVELLLTRFTPGDHVNPLPWSEPLDAEATRVKLILSPHKLSGPGQQNRLFTRMTKTS